MLYTIIITSPNGKTERKNIDALNAKHAHEQAHAPGGATVRAYPTTQDINGNIITYNVLRGALQIAKKSAEKAANGHGTDTQFRILNELTSANAKAGLNGAEHLGTSYLLDIMARTSADSQDIFGYAYNGIVSALMNGADIVEQYHNGYLSINTYIMKQRAATDYETSTEFIEANGGTLVSINSYIVRIINNGERYTPTEDNSTMDAETAARLGAALSSAAAMLTPRQKKITAYIGAGYSQQQAADKLNIKSDATVREHLTIIRKIFLEYFTENVPEFLRLIDSAKVNATAAKRKADRYTKEQRAEYMRAYRARKAAAN